MFDVPAGTSSLLAAAVLRQLLQQQGVEAAERRALVGHIMGTHAHEMTSMVQQLMAGYDAEAGRRFSLEVRPGGIFCLSVRKRGGGSCQHSQIHRQLIA